MSVLRAETVRRLGAVWIVAGSIIACGARSSLRKGPSEDSVGVSGDGDPGGDDSPTGPPGDVPPPVFDPLDCSDLSFNYAIEPATVLLLIDRSGSMQIPFGARVRWDVVRDALFDAETGLVPALSESARFGLAFYTSLNGFAGGACPMMSYSDVALGAADELASLFDTVTPLEDGDTPTGEALEEAVSFLEEDGASGPRYLILITDGEPDTCAVPDPQEGQLDALVGAREAFSSGIEMFVVGISDDIAPSHLQQMANAAQGVRVEAVYGEDADAVRPIIASEDHAILSEQIRGALGDVRTCHIPLGQGVDYSGSFRLYLDGSPLPEEAYVIEDQNVEIVGEYCALVLADAETLDVTVPCLDR